MSKCDKCGKEVPFDNDTTFIEAIVYDEPFHILVNHARHFLPTEDCKGSPSRAQYIEGQPRDDRVNEYGELLYPYRPEREKIWRDAYQKNLDDGKKFKQELGEYLSEAKTVFGSIEIISKEE